MRGTDTPERLITPRRLELAFALLGCAGLVAAVVLAPHDARAAAAQGWPPFVLVSGLLLVGLVANEDGLFAAGGHALTRLAPGGVALYAGTAVLVVSVTTLLNLDTSVTFLTPVLVYAARSRGEGEAPLLYACLLLSNAGSLLLPGSNLTNLIVLGHLHLSGRAFFTHMAPAGLAAAAVTAVVVGALHHRSVPRSRRPPPGAPGPGAGLAIAGHGLVVTLRSPAVPVAPSASAWWPCGRGAARSGTAPDAARILGLPVLVGLFGLAVALGTLGRTWSGPATLLAHLDLWGTAVTAAFCSVVVNNLPAASLLAARQPPHPFALLVGLNVGPNLAVTGSLAWILWLRAARAAGGSPSVARAGLLGLASVPLAIAAAVGVLILNGTA